MVEGANVLEAALDGQADIEALFAAPEAETECPALLDRAARRGIIVHRLGPGVLEKVAGTVTPQPVLAVARRRPPTLADVTTGDDGRRGEEPKLLVVGVDVRDPGNGGTLVRSAEAAGAHGVIFCRGSVDVTNPKTVRASAGAPFTCRSSKAVTRRRCSACSEIWAFSASPPWPTTASGLIASISPAR